MYRLSLHLRQEAHIKLVLICGLSTSTYSCRWGANKSIAGLWPGIKFAFTQFIHLGGESVLPSENTTQCTWG